MVPYRTIVEQSIYDGLVADAETLGSAVAGEISVKLDAMWSEFPLLLLGFFGEAHGHSIAEVNRHMSRAIAKHAALPADMVDRVTVSYLGPESLVLDSFKCKLLTNRPLCDFRNAYMHVRGHATALLCSRRNEGDHRNLKLEARLAYNISGPLLMARLRNGQTIDNMNAADFVTFAGRYFCREALESPGQG